ncbi:MAG: nuclear transport factor 2 family protein [Ginsengibacter sp.]
MKKLFIITITIFYFTVSFAQTIDEVAIRKVLNTQEAAWNQGNIESFMKGYWVSDSLMFIGKSGITYGFQKTLDNYKKGYPDTAAMGKLSFNLLEFKSLSPVYYFVVGKWHLQRSIGNLEGHFTLLFKKINRQWFIIADHSS